MNIKTAIKAAAITTIASISLMMASPVFAQGFINATDNPPAISTATNGAGSLRALVLTIVNFFLLFLGLIAVVIIIYAGFLYVTTAGNQEKVESAKKIIMYVIIGIVIILLSFAIVNTILGAGTGAA